MRKRNLNRFLHQQNAFVIIRTTQNGKLTVWGHWKEPIEPYALTTHEKKFHISQDRSLGESVEDAWAWIQASAVAWGEKNMVELS